MATVEQHLHVMIGQLFLQVAVLRAELDALREQPLSAAAARDPQPDGVRSG